MNKLDKIRTYAQYHIGNLTTEINFKIESDLCDADYLNYLNIEIEHWKDILKIIDNNKELFERMPFFEMQALLIENK